MRRLTIAVLAIACAVALAGCSSFDWDRTASGGDRLSIGVGSCPPAYSNKTELTPQPNDGVSR